MKSEEVTPIECKTGIEFNASNVKSFKQLNKTIYEIGTACIICNIDTIYKVSDNVYAIPITSI